jgi:hypothetical protein
MVEIDTDGEVVYRDRAGRLIEHPADMNVLVACLDPIRPPQPGPPAPGAPHPGPLAQPDRTQAPDRPQNPDRSPIPDDQTDTPPRGFPAQQPPAAPDGPFGPTGYTDRRAGYQNPRSGHRW